MSVDNILSLLGGLALFLYGMHMMSKGLSESAGDRMRSILEKLTSRWWLGILVGALITAVIQSSSATTVMVVGFVNSKLMTLYQAIWIIMGANIGTTVTGLLVALNMGEIAPILAIIGVVFVTFLNNKKLNSIGEIIAGLGILFIGMGMMSSAMYPLRESEMFLNFMSTVSNPFIAILFGAAFTALIQSSSASVGILQTLAMSGLIPLSSSIYIIFGQNIGTCITSVLASINANRNAKRTTIIHILFNIIGTIIFMVLIQFIPLVSIIESLTSNPMAQIAYMHTCFNIVTTLLLIPFGQKLAYLAEAILPISAEETAVNEEEIPLTFVDTQNIGNVPLAILSLKKEVMEMLKLSQKNINTSIQSLVTTIPNALKEVDKVENKINSINYEITKYMSKVSLLQMSPHESDISRSLYKCFSDIERIGDHAYNIVIHAKGEQEKLKNITIVETEINILSNLLNETFNFLMKGKFDEEDFKRVEEIENEIDELTEQYRQNQIDRLAKGEIDSLDMVYYSQIMTDLERVSDHMMNVAEEFNKYHYHLIEE